MSGVDDERFEQYLKEFHPLAPPALPIQGSGWTSRRAAVIATLAVAATVLVFAAVMLRSRTEPIRSAQSESGFAPVEQLANAQPLTIQSANALLAQASSTKAAIDSMAFQSQKTPLLHKQQSALAELSKETNKL